MCFILKHQVKVGLHILQVTVQLVSRYRIVELNVLLYSQFKQLRELAISFSRMFFFYYFSHTTLLRTVSIIIACVLADSQIVNCFNQFVTPVVCVCLYAHLSQNKETSHFSSAKFQQYIVNISRSTIAVQQNQKLINIASKKQKNAAKNNIFFGIWLLVLHNIKMIDPQSLTKIQKIALSQTFGF